MINLEVDKESHSLFFNLLYKELVNRIHDPKRLFSIKKMVMDRGGHNDETNKWETIKVDSYAVHYTSYCVYDSGGETSHSTRYIYDDSDIWGELDIMYKNIIIDKRDKIINDILL